mgnify:CR=1 FL=1|jgi:hypothetical protein
MKNITELTTHLSELFNGLRDGSVDVKVASEMNNTAGKIINAQKVQLEYAALANLAPSIPFLDNK